MAACPVLCQAPVPRRCDRPAEYVAGGIPTCAVHLATATRFLFRGVDTDVVVVTKHDNTESPAP